jgi:hypothetical protein
MNFGFPAAKALENDRHNPGVRMLGGEWPGYLERLGCLGSVRNQPDPARNHHGL